MPKGKHTLLTGPEYDLYIEYAGQRCHMKIKKTTYDRIISRAAKILKEEMRGGVDMLNWNQLEIGDLVDVDGDYNSYPRTRITQKLDDVSRESGLPPGPGFIGADQHGDEFVFSISDVDVTSYEKYALAEAREARAISALRRIIKEHANTFQKLS
jgi:hypothetical protein